MYLVYGESYRLIEEEIKKIIKDETNIVIFDLTENSIEELLIEATYVSMFNEKKIIIVKNALFFTSSKEKEDLDNLLNYMNSPVSLTTIIFTVYEKIDLRKKVTKTFKDKYKVIEVGDLKKQDLTNKVRDMIIQKKYKIDNETLDYIITYCSNNYDLIYNELEKIFLYYLTPTNIEFDIVKEIISKSINDNNFKFIEAIISKNFKLALNILIDLYKLKTDPIVLIILLAREYRLMYSVKFLSSKGYYKKDIIKLLGLQEWQIDKLLRNSSNYYEDDLKEYLIKISDLNYKIVSGNDDQFLVFKAFLLELI